MKLGVSGQALGEVKTLEEIVAVIKSFDLDSIEIWPTNIQQTCMSNVKYHNSRYEGKNINKAKDLLKNNGMKVSCVTMPGAFDGEMAVDIKEYAAALRYTVEVAAELEAAVVNHYCYCLSFDENPDMKKLMQYFEPAIKKAEESGVKLALENEAHDATKTSIGMMKIIKAAGSKNFCTNFDPCNYYHASQEGFPYAYEVLKEHIAYVHIKGGCIYSPESGHSEINRGDIMTGGYAPNHIYYTTISEGALNIDGLLLKLLNDGYEGNCTLEPHVKPENVESYCRGEINYLRSRGFFI